MKTNLPNFDEAKLTAYALNELDAAEMAEVENLIATNPEAKAWVEGVRQTAMLLEGELKMEECPSLTSEQARTIQKQLRVEKSGFWTWSWLPRFGLLEVGMVVATVAIMAAMLLPALSKSKNKARNVVKLNDARQRALEQEMAAAPKEIPAAPAPSATLPVGDVMSLSSATTIEAPTMPAPTRPTFSGGGGGAGGEAQKLGLASKQPLSKSSSQTRSIDRTANLDYGINASVAPASVAAPEPAQSKRDWFYDESKLAARKAEATNKAKSIRRLKSSAQFDTESYAAINDNPFLAALENPLSTFSIDVDTASYANVRRFLTGNQLPPPDAVRIEELVNYFSYNYPHPKGDVPFSVNAEVAGCPWNAEHRLVRIGLKGREIARDKRPPSNLVFLIDVSGSMNEPNKLPLVQESLKLLTRQLTENDRVAIVVYAGAAGEVLPSTSGSDKATILNALNRLSAGGSTHGSAGIRLAYETATANFIQGGVNRVILCTDGDFNVGTTSQGELTRLITDKAKSGVFLSVLGFGMGNYKDSTMETLADKGNGNYAYIDSLNEGRKVLVEQMSGTLVTIAKDVKIQIEFNPAQVSSYRLIGYENRLLAKEDFNNDKKDAGEIGAGHTVTALYEIVPVGNEDSTPGVDPLKYQKPARTTTSAKASDELLTLKLRYKQPDGDVSRLLGTPVRDTGKSYERASTDFRFAAAVAEFGMLLRHSPYKGEATFNSVWEHTRANLGNDPEGYRAEFLTLVETAQRLAGK